MSGISVISYLLANAAAVTGVVPVDSIKVGPVLPLGTSLPAIVVSQISSVPYNLININEANKVHTDRIQVTAISKSYAQLKALMVLILAACPNQAGSVNGVRVSYIKPAAEGPELFDQTTDAYQISRDFIVQRSA